ncbi:hypothetical protein O3G_MSEX014483, partial [Manduca sexta]
CSGDVDGRAHGGALAGADGDARRAGSAAAVRGLLRSVGGARAEETLARRQSIREQDVHHGHGRARDAGHATDAGVQRGRRAPRRLAAVVQRHHAARPQGKQYTR